MAGLENIGVLSHSQPATCYGPEVVPAEVRGLCASHSHLERVVHRFPLIGRASLKVQRPHPLYTGKNALYNF